MVSNGRELKLKPVVCAGIQKIKVKMLLHRENTVPWKNNTK